MNEAARHRAPSPHYSADDPDHEDRVSNGRKLVAAGAAIVGLMIVGGPELIGDKNPATDQRIVQIEQQPVESVVDER